MYYLYTWYKYPSTVSPSSRFIASSYEPYSFFQKTTCSSIENEWLLIISSDPWLSFWPQWKCNCWNTYVLLIGPPDIAGTLASKLWIITRKININFLCLKNFSDEIMLLSGGQFFNARNSLRFRLNCGKTMSITCNNWR